MPQKLGHSALRRITEKCRHRKKWVVFAGVTWESKKLVPGQIGQDCSQGTGSVPSESIELCHWLLGVSSLAQDCFSCQTVVKSTGHFFFLSIEMHNTVMGYSVITFAEDKVQAKKASFPAYPSYLTELNLFFKHMISHLLFSFQVLRADGTQNSLRELACLYFLSFADNLLNRHKPHSLSIQGSLSSQSKITGQ